MIITAKEFIYGSQTLLTVHNLLHRSFITGVPPDPDANVTDRVIPDDTVYELVFEIAFPNVSTLILRLQIKPISPI
jgi:hypothetical protein